MFYQLFANWGVVPLCILRAFQGLIQSGMMCKVFLTTQTLGLYPPQTSLFGRWSPRAERTVMIGISGVIANLGTLLSNIVAPYICSSLGWEWVFYIYGILGVLWSLSWLVYFENSPHEKSNISIEELTYIENDLDLAAADAKVKVSEVPWKSIATCPTFLVIVLSGFLSSIIDFAIADMVPQYLKFVQGLDLSSDGLLSSLPFIMNFMLAVTASFASGKLRIAYACKLISDYAIRNYKQLSTTSIRKIVLSIGMVPMLASFIGLTQVILDRKSEVRQDILLQGGLSVKPSNWSVVSRIRLQRNGRGSRNSSPC